MRTISEVTITLERYEAALAGAEPVTYHKAGCPSALTLGWDPCSPDPKICGALKEHEEKLAAARRTNAAVMLSVKDLPGKLVRR